MSKPLNKIELPMSTGVWALRWSPQTNKIVVGDCSGGVNLYDGKTFRQTTELGGHVLGVLSAPIFPDINFCLTTSLDTKIRIWDLNQGSLCRTITGKHCDGMKAEIHPQGDRFALTRSNGKIDLISFSGTNTDLLVPPKKIEKTNEKKNEEEDEDEDEDEDEEEIVIDQLHNENMAQTLNSKENVDITSIAFSPNGTRLASGSRNGIITLYDLENYTIVKKFHAHSLNVCSLHFSSQDNLLLSGSEDMQVKIFDLEKTKEIHTISAHKSFVLSAKFNPQNQNVFASCSADRNVKVFDRRTINCTHFWKEHKDQVWELDWNPDGSVIASGSDDGTVCFFQI
ncbi:wd repeat-containing protein [Anaeramoeba flamelloides]|uniref:Wd repeat-containing protein n=1 Tax=Anaeramoeba flamelloides TaxID=1746091 RepID=A0ABQ8YBA6_9EUKA|nr:wd repeat-containing protein [Anaeramoeba flamelloides]